MKNLKSTKINSISNSDFLEQRMNRNLAPDVVLFFRIKATGYSSDNH
jgi:hypothetical protein